MLGTEPSTAKYWKWAGLGFEFTAAVCLCLYFGYLFDERYATAPWGMIGGAVLGLVTGIYLLAKEGFAMMRDLDQPGRPPDEPPDDRQETGS